MTQQELKANISWDCCTTQVMLRTLKYYDLQPRIVSLGTLVTSIEYRELT